MDLSQYKKAWENQPEEENKISAIEIYKMTQAKSTSIVKWIFIIGLLEIIFWSSINFLMYKLGYLEIYEELNLTEQLNITSYVSYIITFVFLFLFYKNYQSISTTDNTKTLIKKIIKVRKTVKWYVYLNIIGGFLSMIAFTIIIANSPEELDLLLDIQGQVVDRSQVITVYIISMIVSALIFIGLLSLFYYLIYGILLRKLNRNYKELTALEQSN
jgi:hypothetical protein